LTPTDMGNCQAADAAAVVIQHPGDGKVERLHWPATAADVMRRNPGHYVALVVLHHVDSEPGPAVAGERGGARITKIKLLKPKDTLLLGQVYRLITSQGSCLISTIILMNPPTKDGSWIGFHSRFLSGSLCCLHGD
uniref:Uncharacterized protein n=1 Tax=Aegilops tauschii subsp. strangulata TaxID=200361 RepID=A0A453AJG2_AEGTS